MASRHLSIRIDDEALARLDAESRRSGRTRSEVAKMLLDEGLRMERHPGVVFRSGPGGRRPGLAGGPDIWEVARVLLAVEARGEAAIAEVAEQTGLVEDQVRMALRYYAEFPAAIDDFMRRIDDEAEQAEAAWRRERALLDA